MRTTAGADVAYANDRPPRDATFIKRMRDAGAIILAKANVGTGISRSPFGGVNCNPYDTERSPGTPRGGPRPAPGPQLGPGPVWGETWGPHLLAAPKHTVGRLRPTTGARERSSTV